MYDSTADYSEPHECVFAAKIAPQRVETDTNLAFLFSDRREGFRDLLLFVHASL
jgi:hypothetical protein